MMETQQTIDARKVMKAMECYLRQCEEDGRKPECGFVAPVTGLRLTVDVLPECERRPIRDEMPPICFGGANT